VDIKNRRLFTMKNYRKGAFTCDICNTEMNHGEFRIEIDFNDNVAFCHNKCSRGANGSNEIQCDIVGDLMFSLPNKVYESLTGHYERTGNADFLLIRDKLFEE
jgi:hypothetical protein